MQLLGSWRLPGADSESAFGVLTAKGRLELSLLGELPGTSTASDGHELLLGDLEGGRKATLLNSLRTSSPAFNRLDRTIYEPQVLVSGAHLSDGWTSSIASISAESDVASSWVARIGMDVDLDPSTGNFTAQYTQPSELRWTVASGFEVTVWFQTSHHAIAAWTIDFVVKQPARWRLEFSPSIELRDAMERIGHLEEFLSLLIGRNVELMNLRISVDGLLDQWGYPEELDISKRDAREPIDLGGRRIDPLMTFAAIQPRMKAALSSWMLGRQRWTPVIAHWNLLRQSPRDVPIEYRFRALCSALEASHKLRSGTEKKQGQLKTTLAMISDRWKALSPNDFELDKWIDRVVKTRNWLTHYTERDRLNALDGNGMDTPACSRLWLWSYWQYVDSRRTTSSHALIKIAQSPCARN